MMEHKNIQLNPLAVYVLPKKLNLILWSDVDYKVI